ncbi:transposase [Mesorhizobium intechi]|uniref:transposase n=1 Tax=Mesorhizobium intechi TaxID=537601 RepID=UPI001FE921E1|nr:transposase [Mesorhizobium intechi]
MPADERAAIERHLSLIDQINEALTVVEADIAVRALQHPTIRRLMTLPGLDVTVAASVAAAIRDIRRSAILRGLSPILVSIPSVRPSGEGLAYHGRITKQGRGHARGMLDHLASREAHRAAMIIWHVLSKDADYIWARPALLARKFRSVQLRAGLPTSHARRGSAFDYNIPVKRVEERFRVEKAEAAYAATSPWRTRPERPKAVETAAE